MKQLLIEIQKFKEWASLNYADTLPSKIGGEWETNYNEWDTIITLFREVIKDNNPSDYTDAELSELVYIIARDNECEIMADILTENSEWFMRICELSLQMQESDAKWQLAIRLKYAKDNKQAGIFLEKFLQDSNEYVNRRALMELPSLLPEKVEAFSELLWYRDIYGDAQQYLRMAVLTVLKDSNSPRLEEYLKKAKEDGRKYLVKYADEILSEMRG